MKVYKKIMDVIVMIEELVLVLTTILVLALTFGNVIARYVLHHSWGFTEEIVVAVFVLISLLAAGVAARKGELVNLALLTDNVSLPIQKVLNTVSSVICIVYSAILTYEGWQRVASDNTFSPILHIPTKVFWFFVVIGGVSLILHFVENCIDFLGKKEVEE